MTITRGEENRFVFWDAILSLNANGGLIDTVFVFDYEKTDIGGPGNIRVPLIENSPCWDVRPGNRVAWSATDKVELVINSSAGRTERIIRHTRWVRKPIASADRMAMKELLRRKLEMLGGDVSIADAPTVESPDALPAITGVKAGPKNTIWVQRMGRADEIDPWGINAPNRAEWLGGPVWDVLDPDGRALGVVRLPQRFRVTRVMSNTIVGVQKDELDVERVVILRLDM